MERSVGAVRVLQFRALAALRQEMEKSGQDEQS
jgi:DNA-directed RNA polymerase specialized sigma24 family protein